MKRTMAGVALAASLLTWAAPGRAGAEQIKVFSAAKGKHIMVDRVQKPESEWKKVLTPEQFRITRMKGTERAFTGVYWNHHERGVYRCVACGNDLFVSDAKFESGTGWPSFTAPIAPENVKAAVDKSLFMTRSEILCSRCDSHLGHVFEDGPKPSGLRYCINSGALKFEKGGRRS